MRDLTITLVQADQKWEDKEANFANYEALLTPIASTDLILLPEMFNTAFTMNTSLVESMEGESIAWLKETARKKNAAIYTSLMISENDHFFNRGVFVEPSGKIHTYDKRKCFSMARENEHFTAGNHTTLLDYLGWKIQLHICYDLRFPEISRNALVSGTPKYDLLLYVANWPEKRIEHWNTLLKARAIENQSFVAGVNRFGTDGNGFEYCGGSMLIDPAGKLASLPTNQSAVSFVIKTENLKKIREMLPFLRDL